MTKILQKYLDNYTKQSNIIANIPKQGFLKKAMAIIKPLSNSEQAQQNELFLASQYIQGFHKEVLGIKNLQSLLFEITSINADDMSNDKLIKISTEFNRINTFFRAREAYLPKESQQPQRSA